MQTPPFGNGVKKKKEGLVVVVVQAKKRELEMGGFDFLGFSVFFFFCCVFFFFFFVGFWFFSGENGKLGLNISL